MNKLALSLTLLVVTLTATTASTITAKGKPKAKTTVVATRVEALDQAEGIDCAQPRFSWQLSSSAQGVKQTAYRICVASTPQKLLKRQPDVWDSKWQKSDKQLYINYEGLPLSSGTRYYYRIECQTNAGRAESQVGNWLTGLMSQDEWKAEWIGGHFDTDVEKPADRRTRINARYLRRNFSVDAPIKSAILYICGLGLYEAYINGQRIGTQVLAPGPTNYDREVMYNTFDVTRQVKQGANAIGVTLGNGRYMPLRVPGMRGFGLPRLLAQIVIITTDGKKTVIATDTQWRIMANGPIQTNSEFDGEVYNATLEMPGWTKTGYNDSHWQQAERMKTPAPIVRAQINPNIEVMDSITPRSIYRTSDGRYIIDMGQNMAGWLRIKLHGNEGDTLRLRFAERMKDRDSLFMLNLRTALVTDTYISDGKEATWEPQFTIHGFRYVELSGFSHQPNLSDIQGRVVYDRMATTGTFSTSSNTINSIFHCALWGIRSNYRGIPTDCPQRDERLGWLGDHATGAYGASYIYDAHQLYAKWIRDITLTQRTDSVICDIAPRYWSVYSDNVTWPMAWYTVADMIERQYGDSRPIKENYEPMKRFMLHICNRYSDNGVITRDVYGDWCLPPESPELIHSKDSTRITNGKLLATAAYYRLCLLMERFAQISGNTADISLWQKLGQNTHEAFNRSFYNAKEGYYDNNTVTANILALRWGLVAKGEESRVFGHVTRKMTATGTPHISTGVLGTQEIMRGLTEFGRGDIAYTLATNRTYPSWGFMVDHGATTIWELWNGDTANPRMNSGNHIMLLGDLIIWYYQYLAGIRQTEDSSAYSHIELRPTLFDGLTHVDATYRSPYGPIESHWRIEGRQMHWTFTIPANTTAEVYVPQAGGTYTHSQYGSGTYTVTTCIKAEK